MIKGRLESHGCSLAPCPWRPTSAQSGAENRSRSRSSSQRWTRNGSQYDRNRVLIYLLLYRYFLSNISQIPGRKICRESNHGWNLGGIVGPRSRWKGWNEGEVSWKKWGAGLVIEMFRRGVRSRVSA